MASGRCSGTFIDIFAGPPQLSSPWGIDIDGGRVDFEYAVGTMDLEVEQIAVASQVNRAIMVFDTIGTVIDSLTAPGISPTSVRGSAGIHTVGWDSTTDRGDRAASGVYFIRLRGGQRRPRAQNGSTEMIY